MNACCGVGASGLPPVFGSRYVFGLRVSHYVAVQLLLGVVKVARVALRTTLASRFPDAAATPRLFVGRTMRR